MKRQRPATSNIIENPFVKPENQSWEISPPASLNRSISPPPTNPRRRTKPAFNSIPTKSDTAAVEAGEVEIDDHVTFFSSKLLAATRPQIEGQPRLDHNEWLDLYQRNLNDRGHHFVVHQHDHPVAGTHYDLRLQCNSTSSISFAIMYGLPGDPNSRKLNRNATETRVHNLWNHLIETASYETGTMLLWDTGEYEVLQDPQSNNDSNTDSDSEPDLSSIESEPAKLHRAFQSRRIKVRLHGTRLPKNYTLNFRLTHENNRLAQPEPPAFKRRKRSQPSTTTRRQTHVESSDSDSDLDSTSGPSRPSTHDQSSQSSFEKARAGEKRIPKLGRSVSSLLRTTSPPRPSRKPPGLEHQPSSSLYTSTATATVTATAPSYSSDLVTPKRDKPQDEVGAKHQTTSTSTSASTTNTATTAHQPDDVPESKEDEEVQIRLHNAYPGATNSINSIHQRKWFLSLEREACGFRPTNRIEFGRRVWERPRLRQPSSSSPANEQVRVQGHGQGQGQVQLGGFPSFYVRGRDFETSVLTGRLAADVAQDEGLVNYKPRGGWKAVTD
ncbi:hypothetical protein PV05_02025 [Exophiala xenobiotica]|uniref:DNA ligase D 3'-phosphoesterase domain-containing protein n=1 Tax=Exophiala xenobiotica TaxID=348802 RepID=A0A0D2DI50_9EURO|nr:uncharacterized protein PV05_02025 [Exophiala xenobiotica]KIW61967.1 hypothetical protein PV05_02025 [Exophiala xenobiotica]